jgi:uncharacterized protein YeaO (DUF488 family)
VGVIRLKRVYERRSPDDGWRVLVDRWWPRGVRKESAALDCWAKELAPSDALIELFHHDPRRWSAFQSRFREELKAPAARKTLAELAERAKTGAVTLIFASRDARRNNAAVVKQVLESLAHVSAPSSRPSPPPTRRPSARPAK